MSNARPALLIVDDIEDNRFALTRRLARQGYLNITTATDGQEALKLMNSRQFDLVLLDIAMPRLNGLEAADQIRRTAPRSKIVFLTQERDAEIRLSALAAGALGYVLKTSALRELLPTITEALRNGYAAD